MRGIDLHYWDAAKVTRRKEIKTKSKQTAAYIRHFHEAWQEIKTKSEQTAAYIRHFHDRPKSSRRHLKAKVRKILRKFTNFRMYQRFGLLFQKSHEWPYDLAYFCLQMALAWLWSLMKMTNVCSSLLTFSFDVLQCFMKVENVCSVLLILPTVASWWANLFAAAALPRVATYWL